MFIAHLPAGYLLARACPRLPRMAVLIGSIAPDFDLALVWADLLLRNHHTFLTHRPAVWLALLALAARARWPGAVAFCAGCVLHLCLDSVAGSINWAWPFGTFVLGLIAVPRQPGWWVWSFVAHPVFALELAICLAAAVAWLRTQKRPGGGVRPGRFS